MSDINASIENGQKILSEEVQAFFNHVVWDMPTWKWLSLIGIFVGLYFLRMGLRYLLSRIKKMGFKVDPQTFTHYFIEQKIERPLSWILVSYLAMSAISSLQVLPSIESKLLFILKLIMIWNIIRTCYRAAEAFGMALNSWVRANSTPISNQLAPLVSKTIKVIVLVIGFLLTLQSFGVNVTTLLAGLGIGGIAIAFAAQDTVANLFGTITIILDDPFKIGDTIKIGETEGIVEEVGFRSTSIRTPYNSLLSIPNSVMAKERIDNLSKRKGWIRFRHILGFTYDATPQMLQSFCENLRYQLFQDESVDSKRIVVHFNSYGDSSLNVLVQFHYLLKSDETDPLRINNFLDLIYQVAADCGLSFAFPTRTIIVQQQNSPEESNRLLENRPPTT
ncbi:mechanosensitive ion channel family protein [Pseudobdellovibrio exovorus]|uniref:Mechanosensitive ion channel family protein n=1 Tax=Pseudobdellovibrio exovorus JSS TaxID=1184267 RepID=M4V9F5_9BACT|nr:mechanosensitive ion channel family protein [Pseudobdellovibrio exovorus]AGH96012.1 hypothetical protein A11Q_1796 [Pseudobdellovibrio exovorus JSS]